MSVARKLAECEKVGDRVGISKRGKRVKQGRLLDLVLKERAVEIDVSKLSEDTWKELESIDCNVKKGEGGLITIRLPAKTEVYSMLDVLKAGSVELVAIRPQKESLEELFIRTVKEEVS